MNTPITLSDDLRWVLDGSPAVTYAMALDKQGAFFRPVFVSAHVEDLLGYPVGDWLAKPNFWAGCLHPNDRSRVLANSARLRPDGWVDHEYRVRHRDGGYRWVHDRLRLLPATEERPELAVGVWQDITGRQRADTLLHTVSHLTAGVTGEAFFEALVKHLAEGMGMRYAVLGELTRRSPRRVRTLALYADGGLQPNINYSLAGTPCAEVLSDEPCLYTGDLSRHFPEDELLHEMGVKTYFGVPIRDAEGAVTGLLAFMHDQPREVSATERAVISLFAARAGTELARSRVEEQLRLTDQVFEGSRDAIIITDADSRILQVNPAFEAISGYREEELLGRTPRILQSGEQGSGFYRQMWRALNERGHWQGELWNRRADGRTYPSLLSVSAVSDQRGEVTHYIGIASDISSHKAAERHINYLSHYDTLTGLGNRRMLEEELDRVLRNAQGVQPVGLLFLDLDRFKNINDTLGHDAGDQLLREVGRRLQEVAGAQATVCRVAGDEFALLVPERAHDQCARLARQLVEVVGQPYELTERPLVVTCSVGVAMHPRDGNRREALISAADTALHYAKAHGSNHHQFHEPGMTAAAAERLHLENDLREALRRAEFELHYQPILDTRTLNVLGVEALLRWHHPEEGMIPPDRFIPLAEETGLIRPIGAWVLQTACAQAARWRELGMALSVSVNVSGEQFFGDELPRAVRDALARHRLPPEALILEITESTLMHGSLNIEARLDDFKAIGVRLSLDDFGTGYSSLSYLKRFPIDTLKIDKSFVRDMVTDEHDRTLANTVIAMGHGLSLAVVAEGVESAEHMPLLRQAGCDRVQGYHFSRPLPARKLTEWLRAFRGNTASGPDGGTTGAAQGESTD